MINAFDAENAFLSNFYPSPIFVDGIMYPTVEHAFQAAKTLDFDVRAQISKLSTPGKAKRAGRTLNLREDWEEVKLDVMRDCVDEKFTNPILKEKLLKTGGHVLVEGNTWHDNFWGSCMCDRCRGQGRNELGKILMKLRAELREEEDYYASK